MVDKDTSPSVVADSAVTQALPNTDERSPNRQPKQLIAGVLRPLPPMEDHVYPSDSPSKPPRPSSPSNPALVETQPNKAPAMTTTVSSSPSPSPSGPKEEKKEPKIPYIGEAKTSYGFLVSCAGVICCCFMPDDENHCCNRPSSSSPGCAERGGPCEPCGSRSSG